MTKNNIRSLFWTGYSISKLIIKVIIYVIFIGYILYIGNKATTFSSQMFFGIIGFLVVSISLYYEYLKYLYSKMIKQLTTNCSITAATMQRNNLVKKDIFKGFKGSLILFNSLLLIDSGKYQECLDYMETNHNFFHGTLDYLFIYYHNRAYCNLFLNNKKAGLEDCKHLLEFKNINHKKYSPLFSFDEITGIKYYLEGLHQKAIRYLKNDDTTQLNNREQA